MHIIFVCYDTYAGCSGVHIHFLASSMTQLGHQCTVCVTTLPPVENYFGPVNYTLMTYNDAVQRAQEGFFAGSIVHGWTPREPTRWLVSRLEQTGLPYFLHLEDNERLIMEKEFGKPLIQLRKDARVHPEKYGKNIYYCHPLHFEGFLKKAKGVTCIINSLEKDVPAGLPRMTFWPACEEAFYHITPLPQEKRSAFGIEPGTTVIVYPGTVHQYNAAAIGDLALALDILSEQGRHVKLIRSGIEAVELEDQAGDAYARHVLHAGDIPARDLPSLLSLADILVQPGRPSLYDDYRFPSKVPFFLASGRPLILPRTNIGKELTHGKNALLLNTGSPEEIARQIALLMDHPELATSIGEKGRLFARQSFNWDRSAQNVLDFYASVLS